MVVINRTHKDRCKSICATAVCYTLPLQTQARVAMYSGKITPPQMTQVSEYIATENAENRLAVVDNQCCLTPLPEEPPANIHI